MKAVRSVVLAALLLAILPVFAIFSGPAVEANPQTKPSSPTYDVDPVHSTLIFRIKHKDIAYFYGRFNGMSGQFAFDPENPTAATFEIEVETANVDTNNGRRDGHLKSADFFNAKQFPKITFKSTKIEKDSGNAYRVTGDLHVHGVTRPVTVDLEYIGTREGNRGVACGFDARVKLNRSDFDMNYMLNGGLGDEVVLMIGLEGVRGN